MDEKAKPPAGALCQQPVKNPDPDNYINCGKPAGWIVRHSGPKAERAGYFMCLDCANETIRNGGNYVTVGESYIPVVGHNVPQDEDLSDDIETPASDTIKMVGHLAVEQVALQDKVAQCEAALAEAKEALRYNAEIELPRAMEEAHLTYFEIRGGGRVQLVEGVYASITKARKAVAHAFLNEKAPHIVKHTITIVFGREDAAFFKKFIRDLEQRKRQLKAKIEDSVPWNTLDKYVREMKEAGKLDELPADILGIYHKKVAEVKLPALSGNTDGA